jgi:hypothetical protein
MVAVAAELFGSLCRRQLAIVEANQNADNVFA